MSSTMLTRPGPFELAPVAMRPRRLTTLFVTGLVTVLMAVGGCTSSADETPSTPENRQDSSDVAAEAPAPGQDPSPAEEPPPPGDVAADTPAPGQDRSGGEEAPPAGDGRPQEAFLTIPDIGIERLRIQPYEGQTDDAPGTVIQDRGIAASPHGPSGGVGPGGVGNYQVTAHRNSAGAPFFSIPDLENGARVEIATEERVFVYEVYETRRTSFRSERSLAEQQAAVPGYPGRTPHEAVITLSTCATQEDHAVGNFWSDEFDNPEHRIDKIGILIGSQPA
ncbi:sortase domain-bontaining protein [Streptomyces sp. MS19]|uniref:sortase domain-containing protein n=1 Tax=Streptomyces sp. MS19 TaxID=3385972 RepID=UPI0039A3063F